MTGKEMRTTNALLKWAHEDPKGHDGLITMSWSWVSNTPQSPHLAGGKPCV